MSLTLSVDTPGAMAWGSMCAVLSGLGVPKKEQVTTTAHFGADVYILRVLRFPTG